MTTMRRRSRLDGETRSEQTGPIDWAPSELAIITEAAKVRNQALKTFIAFSALGVASGRYRLAVEGGSTGFTPEHVAEIRGVVQEHMRLRRLLTNTAGSLNQLAASANSGNWPTTAAITSALTYALNTLREHDRVTARVLDLIEPR